MTIRKSLTIALFITLQLVLITLAPYQNARAEGTVVRAILFYSPSCPHCHQVIYEDLPPLFEKYGDQLSIIGINVATQEGQELYQSAVSFFDIPENRIGVPCLVIDDTVLVGSLEIPQEFPGIIAQGLVSGGIEWPAIPGLEAVLETEVQAENKPEESDIQESTAQDSTADQPLEMEAEKPLETLNESISIQQKIAQDPAGNSISIVVLIGMIASVLGVGLATVRTAQRNKIAGANWPTWTIPLLASIGLVIAVYLSYIEFTLTDAICGPIGDCNTVQQSPYARLFGLIPIGVLGAAGYTAIIIAWSLREFGPIKIRKVSTLALWGFAWIGTIFSIYLTILEPFVIGATCMWCVSSAVIMTLLLWATMKPAVKQLR